MATVAIAVIQSSGGLWLEGAVSSVRAADELLVVRPPALTAVGSPPGRPSQPSPAADGRGRFVDLAWEQFKAAEDEARRLSTCDWFMAIDETERLDEELNASLDKLREKPAQAGYFLVARRLALFGGTVSTRRPKPLSSRAGSSGRFLGGLGGAVVCRVADSVASLISTINASSGIRARVEFATRRRASIVRLLCGPPLRCAGAVAEAGWGGGLGTLIYGFAQGYLEAITLAKLWELEHERQSKVKALKRGERPAGRVPQEYSILAGGKTTILVACGAENAAPCLETADPEDCFGEPVAGGGRGAAWIVPLGGGKGVLRWYRRGGLVRYFLRDYYLNLRGAPRPVRELVSCVEASKRGVLVPDVLGVRTDRLLGPVYRGAILTRRVEGAVTVWDALTRSGDPGTRHRLLAAVLAAVRGMHDRGVYHRDLNLNNILVRDLAGGHEVWFVDLDRAAVLEHPVARRLRRRALRRMSRSMLKLAKNASEDFRREASSLAQVCLQEQHF